MHNFIELLRALDTLQGILILAIVALILAIIPYYKKIYLLTKYLFHKEILSIEHFDCHISASVQQSLTSRNSDDRYPDPFIFIGSTFMLSWKVNGAWRVDLDPVGSDLKGNAVELVLRPGMQHFTLTAYGFFQPPITRMLELPEFVIYRLDKTNIATDKIAERSFPKLINHYFTQIDARNLSFAHAKYFTRTIEPKTRQPEASISHVDTKSVMDGTGSRMIIQQWLSKRRILTRLNYSTLRYPFKYHSKNNS
jgi:hypothetical protein